MDYLTYPKYIASAIAISSAAFFAFQSLYNIKNSNSHNKAMGNCITTTNDSSNDNSVISSREYRKFRLIKKEVLTSGQCPVKRFRFEIPEGRCLGLPVGQHISLRATLPNDEGELEEFRRSYTPTSSNDDMGYFEIVVKIYPMGKMTTHLDSLEVGTESIEVAGPKGTFVYKKNMYSEIGMIAGGTGITPMLQVVTEILKDESDKTKVSLLFGNLTEKDIILRDVIDNLQAKHSNFRAYYVLNSPPEGWTQGKGFVNADMVRDHMPLPSEDKSTQVLLCGPPPMIKSMRDSLKKFGYMRHDYFCF